MTYNEFLEFVRKSTKSTAGKGGKVCINHIIKNNGRELDGLVIMEKDSYISPTIYLNSFYKDYECGRKLDDIINEIVSLYNENKNRILINPDYFKNYDNIKNKIVYKIVNYEKNKKLLEKVPHKKILDLAIVYYCLIEQQQEGNATALIYNSHVEKWNITEKDLYEAAYKNTPVLLKSNISSMSSVIMSMMERESTKDENECALNEMYILTNEDKINGAACMLYENVLSDFADKVNRDLYILPSSIHEVILLPKSDEFDKEALTSMVREVNSEGVSYDEILSDHVYVYNRKDGFISV